MFYCIIWYHLATLAQTTFNANEHFIGMDALNDLTFRMVRFLRALFHHWRSGHASVVSDKCTRIYLTRSYHYTITSVHGDI